jgi:dolichol-phosphate mannosyltransferase
VKLDVSIILPTYNERGNIVDLINAIRQNMSGVASQYEVVVVDDNSPDGTAAEVDREFAGQTGVRALLRREERGLASAIRYGIEHSTGEVVVVMDTDFNHDPIMLPQMVKFLEFYDLIVGSRFTYGGGMEANDRYLLSFVYNFFLIRLMFRTQVQDNLSGFLAMRRDRLLDLDLDAIFFGYGDYFIRLLYASQKRRYRILEVPVYYVLRRHGQSKTRFLNVFWQYTKAVARLRLLGLPARPKE